MFTCVCSGTRSCKIVMMEMLVAIRDQLRDWIPEELEEKMSAQKERCAWAAEQLDHNSACGAGRFSLEHVAKAKWPKRSKQSVRRHWGSSL